MKINSVTAIQLNENFNRLAAGMASISDVLAEKAAARSALLMKEDAYARRRREWTERAEMFDAVYAR